MSHSWHLEISAVTDVGVVRSRNEDSIFHSADSSFVIDPALIAHNGELIAVADGVGGLVGGQEASQLVIHHLVHAYYASPVNSVERGLRHAILRANVQAHRAISEIHHNQYSASTLVAAVIRQNQFYLGHLGDSRAYLIRGGKILQLTEDHVLNGRLIRFMATLPDADPEISGPHSLQLHDRLLLCSDGLYRAVSSPLEIAHIVSNTTAEEATEFLLRLAIARGGPDNISIIVVRVSAEPPPTKQTHFMPVGMIRADLDDTTTY